MLVVETVGRIRREHLVKGKSNKEIARALQLAEGTVKIHVAALLRAFDAPTRAGVAAIAARLQDGP